MKEALRKEIYGIEDWKIPQNYDYDLVDWEIAQKNNFVGIAWSINPIPFSETNKEIFVEKFENIYSKPPTKNDISQMFRFVHDIKIDDIVILPTHPDEGIIYFIGKVKSSAYYLKKVVDNVKTVKTRYVADGGVDFVSLNDRGHINYRGQIQKNFKNKKQ